MGAAAWIVVIMRIAAFLLLSAIAAVVSAQSFEGAFTDSIYGGGFNICVDDDDVFGLYTEFGVIVGKADGNTISGTWYEGGVGGCLHGPFELQLSDDGSQFDGTWSCHGEEDVLFPWTGTRLSSVRPDDLECARLDTDVDLEGEYTSASVPELFLCTGGDRLTASYSYNNLYYTGNPALDGYERGDVFLGGALAAGSWVEDNEAGEIVGGGTTIYFRLRDGRTVNVWWGVPQGFFYYYDQYDQGSLHDFTGLDHEIDTDYVRVGGASQDECELHKDLSTEVGSFYTISFGSFFSYVLGTSVSSGSSGAAALLAFVPTVAAVVALGFLM